MKNLFILFTFFLASLSFAHSRSDFVAHDPGYVDKSGGGFGGGDITRYGAYQYDALTDMLIPICPIGHGPSC